MNRLRPITHRLAGVWLVMLWTFSSPGIPASPFIDETYQRSLDSIVDPEPWQEGEFSSVPLPQERDLQEFHVDHPGQNFRYFLDAQHIDIAASGVVRYTLVRQSPSGNRNIVREGLRCNGKEFKTYAYFASGSNFTSFPNATWQPISRATPPHVRDLQVFYLCDFYRQEPRALPDILRALQRGPSGAVMETRPTLLE